MSEKKEGLSTTAWVLVSTLVVAAALLTAPLVLLKAWVRWLVWGWFAPLVGLPRVGYWAAVLFSLLWCTFVAPRPKYAGLEYEDDAFKRALIGAAGDGAVLVLAAAVHFWVLR